MTSIAHSIAWWLASAGLALAAASAVSHADAQAPAAGAGTPREAPCIVASEAAR